MFVTFVSFKDDDDLISAALATFQNDSGPGINVETDFLNAISGRSNAYYIKEDFNYIIRTLLDCTTESEFFLASTELKDDPDCTDFIITTTKIETLDAEDDRVDRANPKKSTSIDEDCDCGDSCDCNTVYPIFIYDAKNDSICGITSIYTSLDGALTSLQERFDRGFIECTNIEGIYRNCEGELLIPQSYELRTGYEGL